MKLNGSISMIINMPPNVEMFHSNISDEDIFGWRLLTLIDERILWHAVLEEQQGWRNKRYIWDLIATLKAIFQFNDEIQSRDIMIRNTHLIQMNNLKNQVWWILKLQLDPNYNDHFPILADLPKLLDKDFFHLYK